MLSENILLSLTKFDYIWNVSLDFIIRRKEVILNVPATFFCSLSVRGEGREEGQCLVLQQRAADNYEYLVVAWEAAKNGILC